MDLLCTLRAPCGALRCGAPARATPGPVPPLRRVWPSSVVLGAPPWPGRRSLPLLGGGPLTRASRYAAFCAPQQSVAYPTNRRFTCRAVLTQAPSRPPPPLGAGGGARLICGWCVIFCRLLFAGHFVQKTPVFPLPVPLLTIRKLSTHRGNVLLLGHARAFSGPGKRNR